MKFEYHFESFSIDPAASQKVAIGKLGSVGWELVTVHRKPGTNDGIYYFKRTIRE